MYTFQLQEQSASAAQQNCVSESYKQRIIEEATVYKGTRRELTEFEKRVNSAAAELCLSNISLVSRRGELLQKAREKAARNYVFKKGRSRSKFYGDPVCETPKRPTLNKEAREDRLQAIEEEARDILRILQFKEKRLTQAEAARNYKTCEQLTEEMMALRSRRNEIDVEKCLLEKKGKRARRRQAKKPFDHRSSDYAGSTPSSRCDTPLGGLMSPPLHSSNSAVSMLSPASVSSSVISHSPGPSHSLSLSRSCSPQFSSTCRPPLIRSRSPSDHSWSCSPINQSYSAQSYMLANRHSPSPSGNHRCFSPAKCRHSSPGNRGHSSPSGNCRRSSPSGGRSRSSPSGSRSRSSPSGGRSRSSPSGSRSRSSPSGSRSRSSPSGSRSRSSPSDSCSRSSPSGNRSHSSPSCSHRRSPTGSCSHSSPSVGHSHSTGHHSHSPTVRYSCSSPSGSRSRSPLNVSCSPNLHF